MRRSLTYKYVIKMGPATTIAILYYTKSGPCLLLYLLVIEPPHGPVTRLWEKVI
jgi:hypothetical protein